MNNYNKIRTILNYGHIVKVVDKDDNIIVFNQIMSDGDLRGSWIEELFERALDKVGITSWDRRDISDLDIKSIEPLPKRYKKLKVGDKVDILLIIEESVDKEYKKMLGQKGLEIKYVHADSGGIYYTVYTRDKSSSYNFPAYAVSPHIGEEKDMIEINGKKFSKGTIEEALKNYIK